VKLMERPEVGGQRPEVNVEATREPGDGVASPESLTSVPGSGALGVGGGGGRGTAFLLAKRRELMGEEGSRRRAEELVAWLAEGVSEVVRETEARVNPSEAIVVRAAHLVERERVATYRERLRSLGVERRGLRFLTSGPWPPYSFSDVGR
jgi:hypothetical protein